jgi:hypothetical protein
MTIGRSGFLHSLYVFHQVSQDVVRFPCCPVNFVPGAEFVCWQFQDDAESGLPHGVVDEFNGGVLLAGAGII